MLLSYSCSNHQTQHSFPTRRSSDLVLRQLPGHVPRVTRRMRELHRRIPQFGAGEVPHRGGKGFLAVVEPEIHDAHRSEEHTSELQSLAYLVCRLLREKYK